MLSTSVGATVTVLQLGDVRSVMEIDSRESDIMGQGNNRSVVVIEV